MDFILFADDANILFSLKDFDLLFKTPNSEMCKLTQWGRAYQQRINFKKSSFMVFRPRQTLLCNQIDSNRIDCVTKIMEFFRLFSLSA